MNHRPGAVLSAGSQTVLPTVRFWSVTTVSFTAVANIRAFGRVLERGSSARRDDAPDAANLATRSACHSQGSDTSPKYRLTRQRPSPTPTTLSPAVMGCMPRGYKNVDVMVGTDPRRVASPSVIILAAWHGERGTGPPLIAQR